MIRLCEKPLKWFFLTKYYHKGEFFIPRFPSKYFLTVFHPREILVFCCWLKLIVRPASWFTRCRGRRSSRVLAPPSLLRTYGCCRSAVRERPASLELDGTRSCRRFVGCFGAFLRNWGRAAIVVRGNSPSVRREGGADTQTRTKPFWPSSDKEKRNYFLLLLAVIIRLLSHLQRIVWGRDHPCIINETIKFHVNTSNRILE